MTSESRDEALIARAVKTSPLFVNWPASVLDELIAMSRVERYEHGKRLHQIGEPGRGLYIVVTGALESSLLQSKGRRFVLGYAPPGDAIGLVPTLDEQATALSEVRAHGDTAVVLIPRVSLRALLEQQPTLLFRLTTELCQNIRRFGVHIERLAILPLRQRMAHALLSLSASYGHPAGTGIEIGLKVSQDDLAAMLSVLAKG